MTQDDLDKMIFPASQPFRRQAFFNATFHRSAGQEKITRVMFRLGLFVKTSLIIHEQSSRRSSGPVGLRRYSSYRDRCPHRPSSR
jgi:hypothetical protein